MVGVNPSLEGLTKPPGRDWKRLPEMFWGAQRLHMEGSLWGMQSEWKDGWKDQHYGICFSKLMYFNVHKLNGHVMQPNNKSVIANQQLVPRTVLL